MEMNQDKYIPALGYGWLTPFYDFLLRLTMPERKFRNQLIEQARIDKDYCILDVGCGTGTLVILIKRNYSESEVIGLDVDKKVLEIARSKIDKNGLDIHLDHYTGFELPYSNTSFDRVFSCLVLHHLTREKKLRMLKEMYRILRSGGELHVADFGKPNNKTMELISSLLWKSEEAYDNVKGLLPKLFFDSGFVEVEETGRFITIFGTLYLFKAKKPK
ncbi:MAG: class I SAM-dependent methyltransferase [Candidatus Aminicenantia bacterium]